MGDPVPDPFGRPPDVDDDERVPYFATFARRMVAWCDPLSGLRPGGSVLDIGAGAGAVSIAAAEVLDPTCHIVAGDVSREAVGRLGALGIARLRPRVLDVTKLDLPDSSCDVVLAGFVVHLLPDPGAALAEIARVLRRSGVAVFSVPGPGPDGGWWARHGAIVDGFARRAGVPPPLRPPPWESLAPDAGLRHRRSTTAEVRLPVGGPERHWRWLLAHGHAGPYEALDEPGRAELRAAVLAGLRHDHPTGGDDVIAGARFVEFAAR